MTLNTKTILLLAVALPLACNSPKTAESAQEQPTETRETSDGDIEESAICIWKEIALREGPAEKAKYLTSIYLGERVTALGDTATDLSSDKRFKYVKVRLSDNSEGWVRKDFVAVGALPGVFRNETMVYKRPDIVTASGKSFATLDFVAITKLDNSTGWSEVIGRRQGDSWFSSGWVKSESLSTSAEDVAISVLYWKACEVKDETMRNAEMENILKNSAFTTSPFYDIISDQLKTPIDSAAGLDFP